MDRIEFDKIKEQLESDPLVAAAMKAVDSKDFLRLHVLSQFPSVEKAAKTLLAIEVERERIIQSVQMLTGLCYQDAELKITQYCKFHKISWNRFYELFTAGKTDIFPT